MHINFVLAETIDFKTSLFRPLQLLTDRICKLLLAVSASFYYIHGPRYMIPTNMCTSFLCKCGPGCPVLAFLLQIFRLIGFTCRAGCHIRARASKRELFMKSRLALRKSFVLSVGLNLKTNKQSNPTKGYSRYSSQSFITAHFLRFCKHWVLVACALTV